MGRLEAIVTDFSNVTRTFILFLALLIQGGAMSLAQQPDQNAFSRCSNTNLIGGYGFTVTGTTTNLEQYSLVGRFVADGRGGVTGTSIQAVNGVISRPAFTGTYTVNPDCSGTATLTFDYGGAAPLEFIIVDDGKTVTIIVAGENGGHGQNEVGTATRQFTKPHVP